MQARLNTDLSAFHIYMPTTSWHKNNLTYPNKSTEVIKNKITCGLAASLPFKGKVTEEATVKLSLEKLNVYNKYMVCPLPFSSKVR